VAWQLPQVEVQNAAVHVAIAAGAVANAAGDVAGRLRMLLMVSMNENCLHDNKRSRDKEIEKG
jgi:hypothetical protein